MYNMLIKIKKAKPCKVGNSFYFRIPSSHIKHGLIDMNKLYNLKLEPK